VRLSPPGKRTFLSLKPFVDSGLIPQQGGGRRAEHSLALLFDYLIGEPLFSGDVGLFVRRLPSSSRF